jgi:hypothetical protein
MNARKLFLSMISIRRDIFLVAFLMLSGNIAAQETIVQYLSGKGNDDGVAWDFFCTAGRNSGEWASIKVPSCWELEGFGTYNYGHDQNKADEAGIYKTTFFVPEQWNNKRVIIVFEGSMTDTQVTVNGQQAGDVHQGAFYRFKRDVTDLIHVGADNELMVHVSKMSSNESVNQAERKADFWVFGGIFRPVYLEVVPNIYIDYTAVDAKHDGTFEADVFLSEDLQHAEISVSVYDKDNLIGVITADADGRSDQVRVSGFIDNVKPWSSEYPNLYRVEFTLSDRGNTLHVINETIGFRTIEVRPRDGVYINGQRIMFKGVNRHSFWPSSGRTTNPAISIKDALLLKEMNMNAVRMAHYPPDRHFLEVCDSLGLYVINELCAWQSPPYDTQVGIQLVYEMITRDVNRPSVIFWANGNEGGFNHDLDPYFHLYDIQNRPLLHPWTLNSDINTLHYIDYNDGINEMFNGRDIFMPTELLHGLYDGGHGAGLDDYWNLMLSNPLSAGLFLWDMTDQGVVRTDKNGILDTDRDHGADGITGPYREKEGSFYTIKEIWSPVFLEKKFITPMWDGTLIMANRYHFTNTRECSFFYTLREFPSLSGNDVRNYTAAIESPDVAPGRQGQLQLDLPDNWKSYDVLYVTAIDKYGRELFTWSFELTDPAQFAGKMFDGHESNEKVTAINTDGQIVLSANGIQVSIDANSGLISGAISNGVTILLSNGPVRISDHTIITQSVSVVDNDDYVRVDVSHVFEHNNRRALTYNWKMHKNGILELEYTYRPANRIAMSGVTFDFPEEGIKGADLLANGPYRVYKNRMKGGQLDIWEKDYNNTITGESWDYPEFKGYYSLFYGMRLHCDTPFEVYSGTEDMTLHLFTPDPQQHYDITRNYTHPEYPKGNLSFMKAIPPVGTKFAPAENYGPQSQLHVNKQYGGRQHTYKVYFRF